MRLHYCSKAAIEAVEFLSPKSVIVSMADSAEQHATLKEQNRAIPRLKLEFCDTAAPTSGVTAPSEENAKSILSFLSDHKDATDFIAQCQVGIGRSQSVIAALLKIQGKEPISIFQNGTYNIRLYKLLLRVAGIPLPAEPLISIAVRIKYAPERLNLFLLSMRRQRYENWEVVAITDGPNRPAIELIETLNDPRIRSIETEVRLGRWGHPYRQRALDECRGEFIGMSNDDNYYVPGYLEQMLFALRTSDLAMCQTLHSYCAWSVVPEGIDLGCWIGRADLVHSVKWPGNEFTSDGDYIQALSHLATERRIAKIPRPLFVHN